MTSLFWYTLAALGEIGGCFAFWAWLRLGRSPLLAFPGTIALVLFALALTRIETAHAGRAFATYGGVYILGAVLWLWLKEGVHPDRWDLIGTAVSLAGAGIILLSPHKS